MKKAQPTQPTLEKVVLQRGDEPVEIVMVGFDRRITAEEVEVVFKGLGLEYATMAVLKALQQQQPDLLTKIWAVSLGKCPISAKVAEGPMGPLIPHTWTFDSGAEIHWGPIDREWPLEARFLAFE